MSDEIADAVEQDLRQTEWASSTARECWGSCYEAEAVGMLDYACAGVCVLWQVKKTERGIDGLD